MQAANWLANLRTALADANPALPYLVIPAIAWLVVYLWRRFSMSSFEKLPDSVQALPAMLLSAILSAASSGGDFKKALLDTVVGFVSGLTAVGLHHALKAAPGPYQGGPPVKNETPTIPAPAAEEPIIPSPTLELRAWLAVAVLSLLVTGCGLLSGAKPYISTAEDAARALCAVYASEKKGISVEDAFKDFCAGEQNYGPFLAVVKEKQQAGKAGVSLKVAALPEDCAEVKP